MTEEKNDKVRLFTSSDFLEGNSCNKAYFSLFGRVYDLTELIEKNRDTIQAENMLEWVGKDISHFFNKKTGLPIEQNQYIINQRSKR